MKKLINVTLLLMIASSCSTYTPMLATDNPTGKKMGKSCAKYVLGFNTSGKEMIRQAAKNGQVKRIATVDRTTSGFFPFVWTKCTIVSGN
jgi:hypothetical protein